MYASHRSIRLHPDTKLQRVKRWGPPCGLSTIAFFGYKAESGFLSCLVFIWGERVQFVIVLKREQVVGVSYGHLRDC